VVTAPAAPAPADRSVDEGGAWQAGDAEGGWWAVERAKVIRDRLAPLLPDAGLVVDIGCGRGEAVELLVDAGAEFVVGCDFEVYPQWELRPGRSAHVVCDAARLPLRDGIAGVATAFDVIEHFASDADPLGSARLVVRDDGHVALTVPALPKLWSPFDDRVGHHRRYTRGTLDAATAAAGLDAERSTTYFFSWLVPPAWLLRGRDRANADAASPGLVGRVTSAAIRLVCAAERAVLHRWRLPIGTSLWTLCRPRDSRS
jgi:SAM-dependent methyltransferase